MNLDFDDWGPVNTAFLTAVVGVCMAVEWVYGLFKGGEGMNDIDKQIFKAITPKTPRQFWDIRGRVPGFPHYREIDRGLQRLRKAGKIKYLKKAEGGPGWVRASSWR